MSATPDAEFLVGTWTFTDPVVPLDAALYALKTKGQPHVAVLSRTATASYYGAVQPDGQAILLLHNDVERSAMSRQRIGPNGQLVEEGRWSSGGQGGSYIAFHPAGRHFVVANAHTGWAVFENGDEPRLIASLSNSGSGPHPRQARSHPHCAIFSPDGGWIYAADMGTDEVLAFAFDPTTGTVGEKVRAFRAAPGSGPRHVLARNGLIYLLNELGNTLVVLRPGIDGTLTELQTLATLPDGYTEFSHTAHLDMSRDGCRLYVSNRGHDSVMFAEVDVEGLVSACGWTPSGGRWPWFFMMTDDNKMLVANNLSDTIALFDIDHAGYLRFESEVSVPHPVFLLPWPDGRTIPAD